MSQNSEVTSSPGKGNKEESPSSVQVEDLEPSELGTKDYWDEAYKDELSNFKKHGIVGDVWFGEDIMYKVLNYLLDSHIVTEDSAIVDLGCGNGVMLLELAREGFKNLTGLDYSENAIEMSKTLLSSHEHSATVKIANLLEDSSTEEAAGTDQEKYDVCLDKGTFDAISLCPDINQSDARTKYFRNVAKLLRQDDSLFVLTSCNWTTSELVSMSADFFKVFELIPTPTFMFGGKAGNVVSIVVTSRLEYLDRIDI